MSFRAEVYLQSISTTDSLSARGRATRSSGNHLLWIPEYSEQAERALQEQLLSSKHKAGNHFSSIMGQGCGMREQVDNIAGLQLNTSKMNKSKQLNPTGSREDFDHLPNHRLNPST